MEWHFLNWLTCHLSIYATSSELFIVLRYYSIFVWRVFQLLELSDPVVYIVKTQNFSQLDRCSTGKLKKLLNTFNYNKHRTTVSYLPSFPRLSSTFSVLIKNTSDNHCGLPTTIVNKEIQSVCLQRKFLLLDATSELVQVHFIGSPPPSPSSGYVTLNWLSKRPLHQVM